MSYKGTLVSGREGVDNKLGKWWLADSFIFAKG